MSYYNLLRVIISNYNPKKDKEIIKRLKDKALEFESVIQEDGEIKAERIYNSSQGYSPNRTLIKNAVKRANEEKCTIEYETIDLENSEGKDEESWEEEEEEKEEKKEEEEETGINVYYLPHEAIDGFEGASFEDPKTYFKSLKNKEGVRKFKLKEFETLFNSEEISDMGFIYFEKEKKKSKYECSCGCKEFVSNLNSYSIFHAEGEKLILQREEATEEETILNCRDCGKSLSFEKTDLN
jgi:hypothetical protein